MGFFIYITMVSFSNYDGYRKRWNKNISNFLKYYNGIRCRHCFLYIENTKEKKRNKEER